MILINKYELLKEVAKRKYSAASIRLINEQPEVKAIPIEWILNYPKFPHKNEDRKKCILDMIADWEKENE